MLLFILICTMLLAPFHIGTCMTLVHDANRGRL